MLHETFRLSEKFGATLTTYVMDNTEEIKMSPRRAIIVCPGGGYHFLSDREAEPIALYYLGKGMNAFVLRYSVAPHCTNYTPLIEAALALRHVRENAEKYNIFFAGEKPVWITWPD